MNFQFAEATHEEKLNRIREVIDEHISPRLASDGGGVTVLDLEENTVLIAYSGACVGCPMALSGTLSMIQEILSEYVDKSLMVKPRFLPFSEGFEEDHLTPTHPPGH